MKKNRIVFSFIATSVSIYFLAFVEIGEIFKNLLNLNIPFLIMSLMFLIINYLLRGFRLENLLHNKIKYSNLSLKTCVDYGVLNFILPLKLGEFSLPALLKRRNKIKIRNGIKIWGALKAFDIFMFSLNLIIVLIFIRLPIFGEDIKYFIYSHLNKVLGVFILVVILFYQVFKKYKSKILIVTKWLFNIENMILTILIFSSLILQFYFLALAVDENVDFKMVFMIFLLIVPLSFQPVQGVANIGTHELAWYSSAVFFGMESDAAINIAISSHILLALMLLFLWLLSFFLKYKNVVFSR